MKVQVHEIHLVPLIHLSLVPFMYFVLRKWSVYTALLWLFFPIKTLK